MKSLIVTSLPSPECRCSTTAWTSCGLLWSRGTTGPGACTTTRSQRGCGPSGATNPFFCDEAAGHRALAGRLLRVPAAAAPAGAQPGATPRGLVVGGGGGPGPGSRAAAQADAGPRLPGEAPLPFISSQALINSSRSLMMLEDEEISSSLVGGGSPGGGRLGLGFRGYGLGVKPKT